MRFYEYQKRYAERILMLQGITNSIKEVLSIMGDTEVADNAGGGESAAAVIATEPTTDAAGVPLPTGEVAGPSPAEDTGGEMEANAGDPEPLADDCASKYTPPPAVQKYMEEESRKHRESNRLSDLAQKKNNRREDVLMVATELLGAKLAVNPDLQPAVAVKDAIERAELLIDEVHKRHDPTEFREEARRINRMGIDEFAKAYPKPAPVEAVTPSEN
jgi:hypothetical protein